MSNLTIAINNEHIHQQKLMYIRCGETIIPTTINLPQCTFSSSPSVTPWNHQCLTYDMSTLMQMLSYSTWAHVSCATHFLHILSTPIGIKKSSQHNQIWTLLILTLWYTNISSPYHYSSPLDTIIIYMLYLKLLILSIVLELRLFPKP
jgi:hypothetical protein